MSEFNQFDQFNESKEEQVMDTEMTSDKVIPAIVKAKSSKKGGKGKVIVLTAAVALASFGAGSLYTSYNWIQEKEAKLAQLSQSNVNKAPNTSLSQTSSVKNGSSMSVAQIADVASSSVVEITTESVQNDMFMRQYVSEGAGSGVVISGDGYIVTNNHVIDGATKITVRLKDGKEYKGKLVGRDTQTDLAVVKIEGATLTPITYGDSDALVVGDTAVAIGNPLGELGGTVTNGIISATDRKIELENQTMTLLQTNAAINPGNSGGGLFNDKGELIGIVVAKSKNVNASTSIEGLGFAIPVNVVKDVVKSIMDVGYVQGRPVLGISVVDVNTAQLARYYGVTQQGVYVAKLTDGTKAAASGLKVGDCIIAVDDSQVSSTSDLSTVLKQHKVGDKVKVTVSREGKLMTLTLELSESVPEKEDTTAEQPKSSQADDSQQRNSVNDFFDFFGGDDGDGFFSFNGQ